MLADVIQRADEITEFLAIYWADGRCKVSKQVQKGLAMAFRKFDAYQLAKYDREGPIRLRDALFLSHAKPKDAIGTCTKHERKAIPRDQLAMMPGEKLYRDLVDGTLPTPQTWETQLSAGHDKKETFESLLREKKLGYMALLRNLRNMEESGVDRGLVIPALIDGAAKSKALPFRFVAAAKAAPTYAPHLERAMLKSLAGMPVLTGTTFILVDVSGSMDAPLSGKSDLTRMEAAAALAMLIRGIGERVGVASFSTTAKQVDAQYEGFQLAAAIINSQPHGGTCVGAAVNQAGALCPSYDRLIVITDEQSSDAVPSPVPGARGYIINCATYKNGVETRGPWHKVHGWSEQVIAYIQALEAQS